MHLTRNDGELKFGTFCNGAVVSGHLNFIVISSGKEVSVIDAMQLKVSKSRKEIPIATTTEKQDTGSGGGVVSS
jgi:hypothetical protein